MLRNYRVFLLLGLAAVLLVVGYALNNRDAGNWHGMVVENRQVPDTHLVDHTGASVRLDDTGGKFGLYFFGYTQCPDVCPATLANYKQVQALLGPEAEMVQVYFVTVDPQRDTPEQLARYVTGFDAGFIGLTGELAKLRRVWESFGVFVEKVERDDSPHYHVNHTTLTYLGDPDGRLRLAYGYGVDPGEIAEDVRRLLAE